MVTSFTFEGKPVVVVASNVTHVTEQISHQRGTSRIRFVGGGEQAVDQTLDEVRDQLIAELGSQHHKPPISPAERVPLRL